MTERNDIVQEGDEVIHSGEKVEGTVVSLDYGTSFKVKWEDGMETLETFHSVDFPNKDN